MTKGGFKKRINIQKRHGRLWDAMFIQTIFRHTEHGEEHVINLEAFGQILDEAKKDKPKPILTQDYGYPERKCKYWVIPDNKEWTKWFRKWFGDD